VSSNAQSQVERMLALVPYLRERDGIAVDDVARDFGVNPSQIVKDLKVLWFCGLPNSVTGDMIDIDMEALDGEGVVRLSNADYLTRPLRLAPHEALALTVALRALREVTAPQERDVVDRALRKIEAAAGEAGQQASAVELTLDPVDVQIRGEVEAALRDGRQLDITYYTPGRDRTTDRVVDPMRLIFSDGHSYLEGWCHRAGEVRMFRVDRIRRASVLDSPAEPPPDADVTDLSKGLFQPDPDDPMAVIDLRPNAHWVAEYYPIEGQEPRDGGVLRVWIRFSNDNWMQRLVLRLGGEASLVEPARLADAVRSRARAALALYAGNTGV
jgi:proteasome accessory factor C